MEKFPSFNKEKGVEKATEFVVKKETTSRDVELNITNQGKQNPDREPAPEGWMTNMALAKGLETGKRTTRIIADKYRETNPEWFKWYKISRGQNREHYHPKLVEIIKKELSDRESAPEGWMTNNALAKDTKSSGETTGIIADKYRETNPEWFKEYKVTDRGHYQEHYHPELVAEITKKIKGNQLELQERKVSVERERKAEEDLISLAQEIVEGETPRAEEVKKLINLFGGSSVVDILNKYLPSYRDIPIKEAKRILGEYLGDFLPTRGSLSIIDEIDEKILLSNLRSFPEELSEVIKNDFLSYYKEKHQQAPEKQDDAIIKDYFSELRDKWKVKAPATFEALDAVTTRAENYYNELNIIAIPERLIEEIDSKRKFPDINQLVNIKELMDKKKILIGDEMAMGKSASVIIAKESFGVQQALVVAPNNVISTWRTYLSQENEGGYFRDGMAPRVLVVENKKSLEGRNLSEYEYVLVSQEKLKGHYMETLSCLPYDMLIVDEIHKLKNITSGTRSKNLLRLAEHIQGDNQYLALLSGTPAPNKIADIAIILKLLYPETFGEINTRTLVRNIMQGNINVRDLLIPRMQMKELANSIEMPRLIGRNIEYTLSTIERDIYETLLEEDELTATQKLHVLQKFLLNPELIDTTPGIQSSKIKAVSSALHETFKNKDKVIMFVNRYAKGITRENWSIVPKLNLPADIEIRTIDGPIKQKNRERIQKELRESKEKILLLVNGQTADVGVDFSAADSVFFYNEPWTKYEFKQQLGRAYRPGRNGDLEYFTFRGKETVEEGIFLHVEAKYRAIEKLLRDIPRSKLEQDLLLEEEKQKGTNLEVHPELAKHYLSSWQKLLKMFTYTKEIGSKDFGRFAKVHGGEYAELYTEQGRRSYQSNANRVTATLLNRFANEKKSDTAPLILDVASGPEMLKRHIAESYKEHVVSVDAIRSHFKDGKGLRAQANFTALPFKNGTFDYVNFSLAFHETGRMSARREEYDRIQTLAEISRVLKKRGRAMVNMIYSMDIVNKKEFRKTASRLGLGVVDRYSGTITAGKNYCSHLVTLEKKKEITENLSSIIEKIIKEKHGLKIEDTEDVVRDQRRILKEFSLQGSKIPVFLNEEDKKVLEEEESILREADGLKKMHGGIHSIPKEQVLQHHFSRYSNGKHYVLFKKLKSGNGWIVVK